MGRRAGEVGAGSALGCYLCQHPSKDGPRRMLGEPEGAFHCALLSCSLPAACPVNKQPWRALLLVETSSNIVTPHFLPATVPQCYSATVLRFRSAGACVLYDRG